MAVSASAPLASVVSATSGSGGAPSPHAARAAGAPVKGSGASAKARGRPRTDLVAEVSNNSKQFSEAPVTDPVWWGPEAKTQVKILKPAGKEVASRLKVATELAEIEALGQAQTVLTNIIHLVEAADTHGIDSDDFKGVFDVCMTSLSLEPVVELPLPPHLTYAQYNREPCAMSGSVYQR